MATLLLLSTLLPWGCQKEPLAPNGLSLSVVEGYKNWPLISVSYRQDLQELHIVLGNTTALQDFLHGIPDNGHSFTDGAILVRLVYPAHSNPLIPGYVEPEHLARLDYMLKDAERFKTTRGWGYASFTYDGEKKAFKPSSNALQSLERCLKCHQLAHKRDYIFTHYTPIVPQHTPSL